MRVFAQETRRQIRAMSRREMYHKGGLIAIIVVRGVRQPALIRSSSSLLVIGSRARVPRLRDECKNHERPPSHREPPCGFLVPPCGFLEPPCGFLVLHLPSEVLLIANALVLWFRFIRPHLQRDDD